MNGHINKGKSVVIQIITEDKVNFQAITQLQPLQTANILMNLAMSFIRIDEKNRLLIQQENKIINPHTGLVNIKTKQAN